jgi:hypothetical protein
MNALPVRTGSWASGLAGPHAALGGKGFSQVGWPGVKMGFDPLAR